MSESFELERAIARDEGKRGAHGSTRALARGGIKRSGRKVTR